MSYKSFFSKVKGIFDYRKPSKINTMDILVVQSKAGDLRSSSFHIDFGWKVLQPSNKDVDLIVNGELLDFKMKLSKKGKAYFEIESNEIPCDNSNWNTDCDFSEDDRILNEETQELSDSKGFPSHDGNLLDFTDGGQSLNISQ